jgi:hypothetical protein
MTEEKPDNQDILKVEEVRKNAEEANDITSDDNEAIAPGDEDQEKTAVKPDDLPWDIVAAKRDVLKAFSDNSEVDLLKVLKDNSFLFFDMYSRKYEIQPIFRELNFGTELKCDFAWLNDNSSGPEWVLVEIEAPQMPLFKTTGRPTVKLHDAIEQVHTWDQYFNENKGEKKRIFGAVAQFRYILVAGKKEDWETEHASKWRVQQLGRFTIPFEIRSMDTFLKSILVAEND